MTAVLLAMSVVFSVLKKIITFFFFFAGGIHHPSLVVSRLERAWMTKKGNLQPTQDKNGKVNTTNLHVLP